MTIRQIAEQFGLEYKTVREAAKTLGHDNPRESFEGVDVFLIVQEARRVHR